MLLLLHGHVILFPTFLVPDFGLVDWLAGRIDAAAAAVLYTQMDVCATFCKSGREIMGIAFRRVYTLLHPADCRI